MNIAALMPVKGFRNAKQRLTPVLSGAARELLAETMFRDVLRQVRTARGLAGTFVVTGDDKVAGIAALAGAEVIRERVENGETAAVDFARQELQRAGCEAVLILPGDMPLVRSRRRRADSRASPARCGAAVCPAGAVPRPQGHQRAAYWRRPMSFRCASATTALLSI